eukprot:tig00020563_g11218.t1
MQAVLGFVRKAGRPCAYEEIETCGLPEDADLAAILQGLVKSGSLQVEILGPHRGRHTHVYWLPLPDSKRTSAGELEAAAPPPPGEHLESNAPRSAAAGEPETPARALAAPSRKRSSSASPVVTDAAAPEAAASSSVAPAEVKDSAEDLKKEIADLDAEIAKWEERDREINRHIDRLHRYNDIKDAGQKMLGRLAEIHGTTTKEMYKQFDVPLAL